MHVFTVAVGEALAPDCCAGRLHALLLLLLLLLVTQYVLRLLMQSPIDDDTSAFRAGYTYSSSHCVCGPVDISPRTMYSPTPLAAGVPH